MSIEQFLHKDERILWSGRAGSGVAFRPMDIFLIPFSIVWLSLALTWFAAAVFGLSGTPPQAPLDHEPPPLIITLVFWGFGAVFVLAGIYFLAGRFLHDMLRRANTSYALTDRRAIIRSGILSKDVRGMPVSPTLEVGVRGGRRGTITFGPGYSFLERAWGLGVWTGGPHPFCFERIANVQDVYGLVIEVQEKVRRA